MVAEPRRFSDLPDYAFPRLRRLLDAHPPGGEPLAMSIGEPTHPMPSFVGPILAAHLDGFRVYPPNEGTPELREAIAGWIARRHGVRIGPEQILPLNGTREGLYNVAMALCPEEKRGQRPVVLIPNPFYQVYLVAALSVGAEPVFVPATEETGFLPDYASLPPALLDRVALAYVCSPSNPQGAVAKREDWARLLDLAERHDFVVLSDECYSEIWRDAPPEGVLAAAAALGADPERVYLFQSLSKRSNLAGLRSGFVAGGKAGIARMLRLRSYAGAPLPLPLQRVAEAAWADEAHVEASRALYQEKYRIADAVLGGLPGYRPPEAGFFLWLPVGDGEATALRLWRETGVRVLPGAYLGRGSGDKPDHDNPGRGYVRVALVAAPEEVRRGLERIRDRL
ncbi:Aspartate/tyrosine/aromatic aminotransferase [Rubellimicrobium thermophilum DSM 16684]|uniref:Aspartate/tyrosine/aromatic aminotransferase n=1 Tax=Rubellimicrobium thermophilum DSM 16684 TaxID=1123069 RepID=S9R1C8_9RHOB|nr:Aspartate/tyrosine/aromatic aminotransferase [Rubellimicrobium thermophilum DSM 16684]